MDIVEEEPKQNVCHHPSPPYPFYLYHRYIGEYIKLTKTTKQYMTPPYMQYLLNQITDLNSSSAAIDLWMNILARHFNFVDSYAISQQADPLNGPLQSKAFIAKVTKLSKPYEEICVIIAIAKGYQHPAQEHLNDYGAAQPNETRFRQFEDDICQYLLMLRRKQWRYPNVPGKAQKTLYAVVAEGRFAKFFALEPGDGYPVDCSGSNSGFYDVGEDVVAIDGILKELSEDACLDASDFEC